jgi:O-Antigen ligase
VDLQQTSSRRSKHSSRRRPANVPVWSPLFLARIVALLMIVVCPWKEGAANWSEQYLLVIGSMLLAGLLGITLLEPLWNVRSIKIGAIPGLSVCFLVVAAFAWIQSVPIFSVEGEGWAPNTIQIQRWFLGYPNRELDERFAATALAQLPDVIEEFDEPKTSSRLALSVEPLHTRAGITGLVMVALMIWLGAVGFAEARWQLVAMIVLTLLGVAMGVLGLAFVLSWNQQNIFGGGANYSFATFVSKNSAGGFLNICLAASLGAANWAFANPRQKEHRYAYVGDSPALRFIRGIEDGFSQLTTPQIASLISTAFILACVFCTGSRGAAISGSVACLVILLVGRFDTHPAGRLVFSGVVVLIGLGVIVGFQLDDRVVERLSTLSLSELELTPSKEGRIYIWPVALNTFAYFWSTGGGLGTFHFSHLPFQTLSGPNWFYHAESLYLQTLVDLGWIGGLLIVTMVYYSIKAIRKIGSKLPNGKTLSGEMRITFGPVYVMAMALIVSQALHSFVDFALILPSLFLPASLMLGILLGSARERRKVDSKIAANRFDESKSSSLARSSPGRSSRIKVLQEVPVPIIPETPKSASVQVRGLVCALAATGFLLLGMGPMQYLARADKMEMWLKKQNSELPQKRDPNPSSFLAGLWGRTGNTIRETPDAMRMIAESLIYEFQLIRMKSLEDESGFSRQLASDNSAAFAVRLAMNDKQSDLEKLPTPKTLDVDQRRAFLGSNEQLTRWEKSLGLIREAQRLSPLDYRLMWDRLVLDYAIDLRKWNGWLDRNRILSQNKPNRLFQLGLIARRMAKEPVRAEALWMDAFKLSTYRVSSVATLLAADTPDESISVDIFPADPAVLNQLLMNPFEPERFPKTNARLWEKIEKTATELSVEHPHRAIWLAAVASQKGDKEMELEFLEEAVRRNPLNRMIRLQWVDRLTIAGQLTMALQQAEYCLSLAPDDVHSEALVKGLKEQVRANTPTN